MSAADIRQQTLDRLDQIDDLPSIPAVVQRVARIIEDPDASAGDVARIIANDPAIAARVLKVVNSVFYAGIFSGEEVKSMQHAIVRLGFDTIKKIALSTSVFSMFRSKNNKLFDRQEFWRHSINTGCIADALFRRAKIDINIPREDLHLAGLLHDVGKIVFEQYFHETFVKILEWTNAKALPLYLVEEKIFQVTHSEVGAWLIAKWNIPDYLAAAVRFHHHPHQSPAKYRNLVMLVHLANYIACEKRLGDSGDNGNPAVADDAWKTLNLKAEDLDEILLAALENSREVEVFLSLAAEG